jgi:hypothetical protein
MYAYNNPTDFDAVFFIWVIQEEGLYVYNMYNIAGEELDGRVVSALGVRSRKLSTGLNGQS